MQNNLVQLLKAALPDTVSVRATQSNLTGGQRSALDGAADSGLNPSYFDLVISEGNDQLSGTYDGFCIDTDRPLGYEGYDFNNDGDTVDRRIKNPILGTIREFDPIEFSATVYSSYETLPDGLIENPQNLDLINWIINQDFVGQPAGDGGVYTVGDIQQTIWQLADNDAGVTDSPDSRNFLDAMFDGFSDARVAEIVAAAQANGEGFVPGFGEKVAVVLVPDGNDGAVDGHPDGQVIFSIVDVNKLVEPAGLGDTVFLDTDRDGLQDAGEAGVAGVTVTLAGAGADGDFGTADDVSLTTTTDANGQYDFSELVAGDYKVTFSDLPSDFEFTTPNAGDDALDSDADPANGMTQVVTLNPGDFNDTLDAGIVEKLAGLGDTVFLDADRDGIQDTGEIGVAGVTVTLSGAGADGLFGTGDDVTDTTTTDINGKYDFTELAAGDYKVTFSDLPSDFEFTTPNVGDDSLDSDADPTNGMTQVVSLRPGDFNDTLDAGIVETAKPGIDIEKFVNGIDVGDGSHLPEIAAGADVTFSYTVTNTGNIAFLANEVVVSDDNGTAHDASDDFTPLLDLTSDVGSDGVLSAGETWLYHSETSAAQNLTTVTDGEDARFHFSGHSYTNGHSGNVQSFMAGDISVEVSAFSSNKHGGNFRSAYLGAYGGGLGVTNQNESGRQHRVDNGYSLDYLLFEFDQDVSVDKAFLDYVGYDSDISVWIGDRNGADISHLDGNLLNSFTQENNFANHGGSRWADFNNGEMFGDTLIISAYTNSSNDSFKLKKLDVSTLGETNIGTYENVATVVAGEVSDRDISGYTNPAPVADPLHFNYEAEDFHLCGYRVEHVGDAIASGGEVIKLSSYNGYASIGFDGPTGDYDILVGYYDENDGQSSARLKVGGDVVDSWIFDQHLPSNVASADNFVERKIEGVHIESGDQLKLLGQMNHAEFARFDYVKIVENAPLGAINQTNALLVDANGPIF